MERTMMESKECYLVAYAAEGVPTSDHLSFRTVAVPVSADSIQEQHVAVEILLLSIDPYLQARLTGREEGLYFSQFNLNEVVVSLGIGKVIASRDDKYEEGDIVLCPVFPVAEYCVIPSQSIARKIDTSSSGVALPEYLSCMGLPGFAAWVATDLLGDLKPDMNVFISAAAGGVGMYAGQLAKLKGCRVIGSTGSNEKVKIAKEEFGYDDAFNYREETDYTAALKKYFPDGIDFYLDNVGGKMLEAVLNNVKPRARILISGMISEYNKVWTEREGVRNLLNMVGKEVKMEGFLAWTYFDRLEGFANSMEEYVRQGKIRSKHKINHGIESFVESLASIFSSSNVGKVIVQVKSF